MVSQDTRAERRTDLDWVRIAAFALLILYHIGMFYVPWAWTIKSPRILPWLQIPMMWSSPWRLLVLFIVSGAATRFMADRLTVAALLKLRSHRLLPPLVFSILIMVPPQSYLQAVQQFRYQSRFIDFIPLFLRPGHNLCLDSRCLFLPTWEHMWFVGYIWVYTVLLIGVLAFAPQAVGQLQERAQRWLAGRRLLIVPIAYLVFAIVALRHFFPPTHNFVDDWYLHAVYLPCFLFGFLFARADAIWTGLVRLRWLALAVALIAYGVEAVYTWHYQGRLAAIELRLLIIPAQAAEQWAWVVAVLGFARRHLIDRDGPARRYLTEAIFPYYIVHQTAIVMIAWSLIGLRLPIAWEAAVLVAGTAASCAATFEIVRRVAWLRPWFGLKPSPASLSIPTAATRRRSWPASAPTSSPPASS